jgi:threonine aldolase
MVFIDVSKTELTAPEIAKCLLDEGISIGLENDSELRAVTHLDVSANDMDTIMGAVGEILRNSA